MAKIESCIYCGDDVDTSTGEGDHVIPKALGEFSGDIHFRRICVKCNNEIGKSEQQITESWTDGHWRGYYWPILKRKGKRAVPRGATGAPPPEIIIEDENVKGGVLVRRDKNGVYQTVDQINVEANDGIVKRIILHPKMNAVNLKDKIDALGFKDIQKMWVNIHNVEYEEHYTNLLNSYAPKGNKEQRRVTERGGEESPATLLSVTTELRYFRSIVKIAFHYYLTRSSRFTGAEDHFKQTRDYILKGWKVGRLYPKGKVFFLIPHTDMTRWHHVLGFLEQTEGKITGFVSLSRGPMNPNPECYYVHLGENKPSALRRDNKCVQEYVYESVDGAPSKAGRVRKLE